MPTLNFQEYGHFPLATCLIQQDSGPWSDQSWFWGNKAFEIDAIRQRAGIPSVYEVTP